MQEEECEEGCDFNKLIQEIGPICAQYKCQAVVHAGEYLLLTSLVAVDIDPMEWFRAALNCEEFQEMITDMIKNKQKDKD